MRFLHTDPFFLGIYYKNTIRNSAHFLNPTKVSLQFLPFLLDLDDFFLRQYIKCAVLSHLLDSFQSVNSGLDRFKVGQHATQPSLIYIVHTTTLCFRFDCILSLLLCTHKEYRTSLGNNICNSIVSFINFSYGFLQINDMDTIPLREDIGRHLGVPSSCVMSKMNTCLQ